MTLLFPLQDMKQTEDNTDAIVQSRTSEKQIMIRMSLVLSITLKYKFGTKDKFETV